MCGLKGGEHSNNTRECGDAEKKKERRKRKKKNETARPKKKVPASFGFQFLCCKMCEVKILKYEKLKITAARWFSGLCPRTGRARGKKSGRTV